MHTPHGHRYFRLLVPFLLFSCVPATGATGSLIGSGDSSNLVRDLTAEGSIDWVYWYNAPAERKSGGSQIGSLTSSGGAAGHCLYDLRGLTWSDGTATPISASGAGAGLCIGGIGSGFSFTAPADATSRTLIVHVGGVSSGATFTAHLSDGSAPDWTDTVPSTASTWDRNYMLTYNAAGGGQTLTVTWTMQSAIGSGTVAISAAALRPAGSPFFYTGKVATQYSPNTMVVNGTLLYSCELKVVSVVDISNPASPSLVTTVPSTNAFNNDNNVFCGLQRNSLVAFAENNAGANGNGFLYFDLSNPRAPLIKTATKIAKTVDEEPVYTTTTAFIPSIAYRSFGGAVTSQYGDLVSVDVTNFDHPAVAGALETQVDASYGGAYNVFGATPVNNQTLYVATTSATGNTTTTGNNGLGELLVVDVSNPAAMSVLKTVSVPGTVHLYRPLIQGNLAVAVGNTAGWQGIYFGGNLVVVTFDSTNPRNPVILGTTTTNVAPFTRTPMASAAIGTNLFLFAGKDSKNNTVLMQVDTTDPVHPKTTNFLVPYGAQYLAVSGTVLYVSADPNFLNGITTFSLPKPISGGTSGGGTCTFTLGASSYAAAAAAGQSTVAVTTQSGCGWTATSNASWISITAGASGTGSGTVSFTLTANSAASQRTGTLTIGGQTFTVTQVAAAACTYSITPINAYVAYSGGTGTVAVTAGTGCAWTATSGAAWITITAGSSGTGSGTVSYSAAANTAATERTGTLTIAGQSFPVTEDGVPAACTYSISPLTASAVAGGGSGTVTVTAGTGCAWTATSNATWITITAGASGTGNGTVSYSVAANTGAAQRTGTLTIGGQTFTLTQSGGGSGGSDVVLKVDGGTFAQSIGFAQGLPHVYFVNRLTPPSYPATLKNVQIFFGNRSSGLPVNLAITIVDGASTGSGNTISGVTLATLGAAVNTLDAFNTYTVVPLTITSGDFLVGFSVDNPPGIYPADLDTDTPSQQRSYYSSDGRQFGLLDAAGMAGNLAIRATVTVGSGGGACTYALQTPATTAPPASGTGTLGITTQNGCSWTAVSNASWITITSATSGTGTTVIFYKLDANSGQNQRLGTITVGGQTYTITQIGMSACSFALSPTSATAPAGGTIGTMNVMTSAGCPISVVINANWITITSSDTDLVSGVIKYSVAPNTDASSRTGTLTLAGLTFTITQAGTASTSQAPAISDGGVVNTADFTANFAPGVIFSIFGQNLAPSITLAGAPPLPTSLAGTSVEALYSNRTVSLPLFFVSTTQVNAQLPFDVPLDQVQIRVRTSAGVSNTQIILVDAANPRIFTAPSGGSGAAAALHGDYSVVSDQAPANPGEWLTLYLTGMGAVSPAIAAGQPAGDGAGKGPLNKVSATVTVTVNGVSAQVYYAGLAPSYAGLYQINFQVPADAQLGPAEIVATAAGSSSQPQVTCQISLQWSAPAVKTIGPAGGTVSSSDISVTVPAGVLASAQDLKIYESSGSAPNAADHLGPVFRLEGLPATTSGPIMVSVQLTGGTPPAQGTYLVLEEAGGGQMFVQATVNGNQVIAILPPRNGAPAASSAAASGKAMASHAAGDSNLGNFLVLWIATEVHYVVSPKGYFEVIYLDNYFSKYANTIIAGMDAALDELIAMGFDTKIHNSLPIQVRFSPTFSDKREDEDFGNVATVKWSGQRMVRLASYYSAHYRSEMQAYPDQPEDELLRAKAVHLLFHYVQQLYDADNRETLRDQSMLHPWAWWDEATALVFEEHHLTCSPRDLISVQAWSNRFSRGPENSNDQRQWPADLQGVAYSFFLQGLWNQGLNSEWISNTYRRLDIQGATLLPSQAMINELSADTVKSAWLDFGARLASGKMYPAPAPANKIGWWNRDWCPVDEEADLTIHSNWSKAWSSPDLSAYALAIKFSLLDPTGSTRASYGNPGTRVSFAFNGEGAGYLFSPLTQQVVSLPYDAPYTDQMWGTTPFYLLVSNSHVNQTQPHSNSIGITVQVKISCTYGVSPTSASIPAAGGSGSVTVTVGSGCTWTATSNANWIAITAGQSGNGNGTVAYTVDANPGSGQRSGTLMVAGQAVTVTQAGTTSSSSWPSHAFFVWSDSAIGGMQSDDIRVTPRGNTGFDGSRTLLPVIGGYQVSGSFSADYSLLSGSFEISQQNFSSSNIRDLAVVFANLPCTGSPASTSAYVECKANAAGFVSSYTYTVKDATGKQLSVSHSTSGPAGAAIELHFWP